MKRPTYQQLSALVTELVTAIVDAADATSPQTGDYLVGIVLRHVDSWAAKP